MVGRRGWRVSTSKKLALIAIGYALCAVVGFAGVAVNEALMSDDVAQGSRRRGAEAVNPLLAGVCKIRGRVAGDAQSAHLPEPALRHGGRRDPVPVHGRLRM